MPEYWVISTQHLTIEVMREPANGVYQRTEVFDQDATVRPANAPDIALRLRDLLR